MQIFGVNAFVIYIDSLNIKKKKVIKQICAKDITCIPKLKIK